MKSIKESFQNLRNAILYEIKRIVFLSIVSLSGLFYFRGWKAFGDIQWACESAYYWYYPKPVIVVPPPPPKEVTWLDTLIEVKAGFLVCLQWCYETWCEHWFIGTIPVLVVACCLFWVTLKVLSWSIFGCRRQIYVSILKARGVYVPEAVMPGSAFVKGTMPSCQISICRPGILTDSHIGYAVVVNGMVFTAAHVVDRFEGQTVVLKSADGEHKELWTVSYRHSRIFADICMLFIDNNICSRLRARGGTPYVGNVPAVCSGEAYGEEGKTRGNITKNPTLVGSYTYGGTTKPGMSGCPIFVDGRILSVHQGVNSGYNISISMEAILFEFTRVMTGESKKRKIGGDQYDDKIIIDQVKGSTGDSYKTWSMSALKKDIASTSQKDPEPFYITPKGKDWNDSDWEDEAVLEINGRKFVPLTQKQSKDGVLTPEQPAVQVFESNGAMEVVAVKCRCCARVFATESDLNVHMSQRSNKCIKKMEELANQAKLAEKKANCGGLAFGFTGEAAEWLDLLDEREDARAANSFIRETSNGFIDDDQAEPIEEVQPSFLDQRPSLKKKSKKLKKTSKLVTDPLPSTSTQYQMQSPSTLENSGKNLKKDQKNCSGQSSANSQN